MNTRGPRADSSGVGRMHRSASVCIRAGPAYIPLTF